jgi:hypothetical protein
MDKLLLNKTDFRFLLMASAVLPVLCFMAGFFLANNTGNSYQAALTPTSTSLSLDVPEISQPTQISDDQSAVAQISIPLDVTHLSEQKPSDYMVQAGLFSSYENAKKFKDDLLDQDIESQIVHTEHNGKLSYRLILDSFESKDEAVEFTAFAEKSYKLDLYITFLEKVFSIDRIAAL